MRSTDPAERLSAQSDNDLDATSEQLNTGHAPRSRHTGAVLLVVVAGVLAATLLGGTDREQTVSSGTVMTRATPSTPVPDVATTIASTVLSTPTPSTPAQPKPAHEPPTTAVRTFASAPARASSAGDLGTVVTIEHPGLYALDVTTGAMRRLGDPAIFDVAGDQVLTAAGNAVSSTEIHTGHRRQLYTVSGGQPITLLEAAANGTAVVRTSNVQLLGPAGEVINGDFRSFGEVQWSGDGTVVVRTDSDGLHGTRANGVEAWGPAALPESIVSNVRVSSDGGLVAGEFNGHTVRLLDVASGAWRETGVWRDVDFGPGGRLMGQPTPPPGWNGRTPLGLSIWNAVDRSRTPYSSTGAEPAWAPTGEHAVTVDAPVAGPDDGTHFSLRVRDSSGRTRFTLHSPTNRLTREGDRNSAGGGLGGPSWSADGRYVVVGAR